MAPRRGQPKSCLHKRHSWGPPSAEPGVELQAAAECRNVLLLPSGSSPVQYKGGTGAPSAPPALLLRFPRGRGPVRHPGPSALRAPKPGPEVPKLGAPSSVLGPLDVREALAVARGAAGSSSGPGRSPGAGTAGGGEAEVPAPPAPSAAPPLCPPAPSSLPGPGGRRPGLLPLQGKATN